MKRLAFLEDAARSRTQTYGIVCARGHAYVSKCVEFMSMCGCMAVCVCVMYTPDAAEETCFSDHLWHGARSRKLVHTQLHLLSHVACIQRHRRKCGIEITFLHEACAHQRAIISGGGFVQPQARHKTCVQLRKCQFSGEILLAQSTLNDCTLRNAARS